MSSVSEKKFQYIGWKIDNNGSDVSLNSRIYDDVNIIFEQLKHKNFVIAIGLNPSNTTEFNDDVTNLYLRDKIYKELKTDGYLLTNLCCKIESDSQNIRIGDFDDSHICDLIMLIEQFTEKQIIIFFGQTGTKFLNNNKISAFNKLKELLLKEKKRIYYTRNSPKFIHPGRSGQDYEFKLLEDDRVLEDH